MLEMSCGNDCFKVHLGFSPEYRGEEPIDANAHLTSRPFDLTAVARGYLPALFLYPEVHGKLVLGKAPVGVFEARTQCHGCRVGKI